MKEVGIDPDVYRSAMKDPSKGVDQKIKCVDACMLKYYKVVSKILIFQTSICKTVLYRYVIKKYCLHLTIQIYGLGPDSTVFSHKYLNLMMNLF